MTNKRKIQKGDRVRVYGLSQMGDVDAGYRGLKGTVITVSHNFLNVTLDKKKLQQDLWNTWYTMQCRRLKPKQKKVPREIWVPELKNGYIWSFMTKEQCVESWKNEATFKRAVRFREVIEKQQPPTGLRRRR